jgi:phosphodiesterase/alkaline phosphatase D-like protein
MVPGNECVTLADYRARYALYRTDGDLQEAHRLLPWILIPDDHEVSALHTCSSTMLCVALHLQ